MKKPVPLRTPPQDSAFPVKLPAKERDRPGGRVRPVRMVACFYAMQSQRSEASAFVTEETARDLVEAGQGHWSANGKHIVFAKTQAEMPRAAESLTMGPHVMEGFAAGVTRYVALVGAWHSTFQISSSQCSASA